MVPGLILGNISFFFFLFIKDFDILALICFNWQFYINFNASLVFRVNYQRDFFLLFSFFFLLTLFKFWKRRKSPFFYVFSFFFQNSVKPSLIIDTSFFFTCIPIFFTFSLLFMKYTRVLRSIRVYNVSDSYSISKSRRKCIHYTANDYRQMAVNLLIFRAISKDKCLRFIWKSKYSESTYNVCNNYRHRLGRKQTADENM